MALSLLLYVLITIIGLAYYLVKKRHSYWSDRGIVSIVPKFLEDIVGGVGRTTTLGEKVASQYFALKGNGVVGGTYFFTNPTALVLDLDFLRHVFVKDFNYFMDRGMYVNEKADPLSAHLFSIEGEKWKKMRAKLSPTFTSGKMKMMHSTFLLVAQQFNEHLRPMAKKNLEVEVKELFAQFTTDIIGNVAFGLECNSMKDPNSEFRSYGRKIFERKPTDFIKFLAVVAFPNMAKRLNMRLTKPDVSEFFLQTVRKTIDYRQQNKVERNDFLQLLMQLMKDGKLGDEAVEVGKISFEELAAQTFLFFIAGFETSSSTMTFATYELALNQDLQDKAREEIRDVLKRHNGVLNYEAALELTYLDQIIQGVFIET